MAETLVRLNARFCSAFQRAIAYACVLSCSIIIMLKTPMSECSTSNRLCRIEPHHGPCSNAYTCMHACISLSLLQKCNNKGQCSCFFEFSGPACEDYPGEIPLQPPNEGSTLLKFYTCAPHLLLDLIHLPLQIVAP